MRRTLLLCVAVAGCGRTQPIHFFTSSALTNGCGQSLASGPSWTTYADDALAQPLGPARPVCLTPAVPSGCPANALVYGHEGGWTSALSPLGAQWIWRPDAALGASADLARAVFSRSFALSGKPGGKLTLAADDSAEVRVNGASVGMVGSVADIDFAAAAQSHPVTVDLTPFLKPGENTLTVVGQNGPATYAACTGPCDYAHNPAGVVFAGELRCD